MNTSPHTDSKGSASATAPPRQEDGADPHPYAIRRRRVIDALGADVMVLAAAPVLGRPGASESPYHPDSDVLYLSGWEEPMSVFVIRGHGDDTRFVAFVRARDAAEEAWSGARLGVEGAAARLEADAVYPMERLESHLLPLLQGADRVHFRLGSDVRTEAIVRDALQWGCTKGARRGKGPRGLVDPGVILGPMRRVKDAAEIQRLRRAAAVSRESFAALDDFVRPGVGEWEIEALLESGFRVRGARGPAFPTIVGSGDNGCVLHYTENSARVAEETVVVVDGGAELDWYASDMTRSYLSSPDGDGRRPAIMDLVDAARSAAIDAVRPGVPFEEIHRVVSVTLLDGLVGLGVLRGEVADLLERSQDQAFFPHQTSHWLGLDVHDPGDYAENGRPVLLESGMVLTVEPGLYFARHGAAWRLAQRDDAPPSGPLPSDPPPVFDSVVERVAEGFEGIGVRIEDTVLVTAEGREILTR